MKVFNLNIGIQKQFYDSTPTPNSPHLSRLKVTLKSLVVIQKKNASYRHAKKMKAFNLHKRNLRLFSDPTLTLK